MTYSTSDAFSDLLCSLVPGFEPADEEDEEDPAVYVDAALEEIERLRTIERCAREVAFSMPSQGASALLLLRDALEPGTPE